MELKRVFWFICFFLQLLRVHHTAAQRSTIRFQELLEQTNTASSGSIYFLLNQPTYTPGDTAYISLWLRTYFQPTKQTDPVVQLNVYDGNGVLIQFQKCKIRKGRGTTQLVVREGLLPGRYQIVAFTPSMLHEFPQRYASQWFDIEIDKKIDEHPWLKSLPTRAFVEGHKLITDLNAKVFLTGSPGEVATITGDSLLIAKIAIPESGITSWMLKPESGKTYVVRFVASGRQVVLPEVSSDGIAIESDGEQVLFSVGQNSQFIGMALSWVAVNNGLVLNLKPFSFEAGRTRVAIPVITTKSGITEYYVLDKDGVPITHRKLISMERGVNLHLDVAGGTHQRDSVSVRFRLESNGFASRAGNFVVWVVQQRLFDMQQIISQFPQTPFATLNEWLAQHPNHSHNTLNDIIAVFPEPFFVKSRVQPADEQRDELVLKGKIFSAVTEQPVADSLIVVAYLQNNAMGYETFTKNGGFEIRSLLDFWGSESVFISLRNKNLSLDATHRIEIENDTLAFRDRWENPQTDTPSLLGEYATFSSLVRTSYRFFNLQSNGQVKTTNPNQLLEEEFQEPDFVVDVEKYVVFPTMQDLIKEAVPFVQVRNKRQGRQVRLAYRTKNATRIFGGNPLLVIDGRLTFDVDFFLDLLPADISFIKVLNNPNKLSQLGKLGENGVLFIQTKALAAKGKVPASHYVNMVGLTRPRPFFTPDVLDDLQHPDFRSTLFWNGDLRLSPTTPEAQVAFRASDDLGTMLIVVAGFTDEGQWLYQTATFEVKRKLR